MADVRERTINLRERRREMRRSCNRSHSCDDRRGVDLDKRQPFSITVMFDMLRGASSTACHLDGSREIILEWRRRVASWRP